jgi:pectate lyase
LAFPTAEGYAKFAKGGRGGKVYEVTTLSGSGAGSLGAAFSASGPRTVVFRVSGTITGNFDIPNGNITVAGQTAPGDGICIKGHLEISANDVIIRYIRVRPNATGDAIGGRGIENVILDHVSCSWSSDEVLSIYQAKTLTIQYCLISEACGGSHRFGGIWGAQNGTYHHNCFAHNDNRTPRWAGKKNESNDYRNNVLYNPGYGGCYGALGGDVINMVANYHKPGPATDNPTRIAAPSGGNWHVSENVVVGADDVTADNWKGMHGSSFKRMDEPWPSMPIKQETAEEAYQTFLDHGGCSFPNRDALDTRIVEEIRTGTGQFGSNGIISKPGDVGGCPELKSTEPPPDKDKDGMPDAWETQNGLNPDDASDGGKTGKGGYTNLENYLNGLVAQNSLTAKERRTLYNIRLSHRYPGTLQAWPQIEFSFPSKSRVKLEAFGITGQRAAVLVDGVREAGVHRVDFNGSNLSPGLYIYRLTTDKASLSNKVFLGGR